MGANEVMVVEPVEIEQALERAEIKKGVKAMNSLAHSLGGDDAIFDLIVGGHSISDIAKQAGIDEGSFYRWADKTPERRASLAHARARAADQLAERSLSIMDNADTALDLKKAEMRMKSMQWIAAKWNRDVYGDGPAVQVNISADNMHLNALRKRGE